MKRDHQTDRPRHEINIAPETIVKAVRNPRIESRIREIAGDRAHGADRLSDEALRVMGEAALEAQAGNAEEHIALLGETARRLSGSRPSMAPITNKVSRLLYEFQNVRVPLEELRQTAARRASELIEASEADKMRAVKNILGVLEEAGTIMTFSYSSTVREALKWRPSVRVIAPESRPLSEGVRLARELAGEGLRVTLIADAAVASFMGEADAALVGADGVLADGSIVKKVRTRLLTLAATDEGAPFYSVCTTAKFDVMSLLGRQPVIEEGEPEFEAPGVEVRNPLFEATPARLVTSIVTERGAMGPEEVGPAMEGMRRYVEALLGTDN